MAKILPIFLPFASCGNRCLFCNQQAITGETERQDIFQSALDQVSHWLQVADTWEQIAFYGGNFGAIDKSVRLKLYSLAENCNATGIRFSTRPDTINQNLIAEIKDNNITCVELGIQSLDNNVLKANGRPYDKDDVYKAIDMVSSVTSCGVQLMTGMYLQSPISAIEDAKSLSELNITTARIYPTQVLYNTGLYNYFAEGKYVSPDFADTLVTAAGMYIAFKSKGVDVIRVGLPEDNISDYVVSGVRHEALGDIVKTLIVMLYFESGKVYNFSGYKGIVRKTFPELFKGKEDDDIDFYQVCSSVRSGFLEDSQRFIKGKAAYFAKKLESTSYNG